MAAEPAEPVDAAPDEAPADAIIDAHCHIASPEHVPRSFIDGVAENMAAQLAAQGITIPPGKIAGMYLEKLHDPLGDELVAEMTAAGIAKAVLLVPDFTCALADCPRTIEESLRQHHEVLQRHPDRFTVFAGVDPRWGQSGVDLFERAIDDWGFRGFKVYPPCGVSPSDPEFFPFYEICAARRLPVLIHIGPTSPALRFDTASPFLVDAAAHRFPTVSFILAHAPVAFANECMMLARFRPNVFLDLSGFQTTLGWDPALTAVERMVTSGLNHKILFGTDFPAFRLQGSQQTFLDAIARPEGPLRNVSESDRALILGGNAQRLLNESWTAQPSFDTSDRTTEA